MIIEEVMKSASSLGACMNLNGVKDWTRTVSLFFSPMGREFCETHNFPSMDYFRKMGEEVKAHNVFIDSGSIELTNQSQVALVGNTQADLYYDDNTRIHKIVLMHGAKAKIKAKDYAVIHVVNISGGEVGIQKDETVKIL